MRGILAYLHIIGEQVLNAIGIRHWHFPSPQIVDPILIHEVFAELPAERADIAQESRAHQAISKQTHTLLLQLFKVIVPATQKALISHYFLMF